MKKAAIYARVSTEQQGKEDKVSIESQLPPDNFPKIWGMFLVFMLVLFGFLSCTRTVREGVSDVAKWLIAQESVHVIKAKADADSQATDDTIRLATWLTILAIPAAGFITGLLIFIFLARFLLNNWKTIYKAYRRGY